MKALIWIAILIGGYFAILSIKDFMTNTELPEVQPKFTDEYTTTYDDMTSSPVSGSQGATQRVAVSSLSGMPANLEASYQQAKANGFVSLKAWIFQNRANVRDPRLADIQLDYVIAVTTDDLLEAKRVFAQVRGRIDSSSPVYSRLQSMSRNYE